MNYIVINTGLYNGTQKGVNTFYAAPILSGPHIGKFAASENAITEFLELFQSIPYEVVDLPLSAFEIDYTPPTPIGYKILIPTYWGMLFPDDKFIIGSYEAKLERKNNALVVDVAYLQWTPFRQELLKPENATLARQMGAVMRYLENEAINKNWV